MWGTEVALLSQRSGTVAWLDVWNTVRDTLRQELGQGLFDSWIAPLSFGGAERGAVRLIAPRRLVRDYVTNHHTARLERLFTQTASDFVSLEIEVSAQEPKAAAAVKRAPAPGTLGAGMPAKGAPPSVQGLWDRQPDALQSFQNFVVGPANEFAFKAAQRTAGQCDAELGLLFLHGGFGYGKTHLLNAIQLEARASRGARVLFLRAEDFMRRFLSAIRSQEQLAFKEELRAADILLIDDLQHICGRSATISEFLHTVNAFTDLKRNVVIAADRPPGLLEGLTDDIRSRLKGAIVIALDKPDADTRLAILKARASDTEKNRPRAVLPDAVLERIASEPDMSPRELLGALRKLSTYAELTGKQLTPEIVEEAIGTRASAGEKRATVEEIQKKTAEFYKLDLRELHSARRTRYVARPRQVAMYLARELTSRSLPDIGRRFGGRDHTTVLHACRRIEALCKTDPLFQQEVEFLRKVLGCAGRG